MNKNLTPKWIPIFGEFSYQKEEMVFIGDDNSIKRPSIASKEEIPAVVMKSNLLFSEGEISLDFNISNPDMKVQLMIHEGNLESLRLGVNMGKHAYGIASMLGDRVVDEDFVGLGVKIDTKRWYNMKVKSQGSYVKLFIDGVEVSKMNVSPRRSQMILSLGGYGQARIRNVNIIDRKPVAFIVMQFGSEFDHLYKVVIKKVCEEFGYEVVRADEIFSNGLIIDDIISSIRASSVVIADITPNNPNVFYEVGYAHGISKPTILLSDKTRERLPFDVSGMRTIFYDNTIGGKDVVEDTLRSHLKALA